MNYLAKLAKYGLPCIGLGGGAYYLAQPEKRRLDDVEKSRLNRYLPPVNKLTGVYNGGFRDAIISGSFVMRLYTDRTFPVNDYDVYVDSDNYSADKIHNDQNKLKTIYPDVDFNIEQFSYDDLSYINGIINTKSNDKTIQYIMVNTHLIKEGELTLSEWHSKFVDIPVFIRYENGVPYFHVRTRFEGFMAKYCGVLFQLNNKRRKTKYEAKGFWVL